MFDLSRQLIRQEAMIDHLLSRVKSLEEASTINEMREQLNRQHKDPGLASYANEPDGASNPIRYCSKEKPSSIQSSGQDFSTSVYDSDSSGLVKSSPKDKRKRKKSLVPQDSLCLPTASNKDGSSGSKNSDSVTRKSSSVQLESSGHDSSISKTRSSKRSYATASSPPIASPIVLSQNAISPLSSSEIDKSALLPVEDVVKKYRSEGPMTLAAKLASEAFFDQAVLARCSPMGMGKRKPRPALPNKELNQIKQIVLNNYPIYWGCPQEFEPMWRRAISCIGSECWKARDFVCSQIVD